MSTVLTKMVTLFKLKIERVLEVNKMSFFSGEYELVSNW